MQVYSSQLQFYISILQFWVYAVLYLTEKWGVGSEMWEKVAMTVFIFLSGGENKLA